MKAATSIQETGQNALNISSNIKAGVGKYAMCYGTQAARKRFGSKYPQYELKWSTTNAWKKKFAKDPESRVGPITKAGTLNKVNN